MIFRPCIDLHEGKVKQIVGSSLNDEGAKENYVSSHGADYYANLYKESGLIGGHVIALGKGNQGEIEKALKAYPKGLQVGGGINADNAAWYINEGASHVIVTSYIFSKGKFELENLMKMTELIGKEHLVIDLSCRKKDNTYYVVTDRWQKYTEFEINKENLAYLSKFCSEFLIHAVDVEGLQSGIDIELLQKMSEWVTIPCTYAGGIQSMEDIEIIDQMGKGRIDFTVGSGLDLFGGQLFFDELVRYK